MFSILIQTQLVPNNVLYSLFTYILHHIHKRRNPKMVIIYQNLRSVMVLFKLNDLNITILFRYYIVI